MSTPFPLASVMQLAKDACEAAALRVAQTIQRVQQADQQLKMLLQYREEYQTRFRDAVASGIDSHGWMNFHAFMDKLDTAIDGANKQAEAAREIARRAQTEWMEHQRKLKAYDVLATRHQRAEAVGEARREQRATDEQAMTLLRMKPPTMRMR